MSLERVEKPTAHDAKPPIINASEYQQGGKGQDKAEKNPAKQPEKQTEQAAAAPQPAKVDIDALVQQSIALEATMRQIMEKSMSALIKYHGADYMESAYNHPNVEPSLRQTVMDAIAKDRIANSRLV